MKKQSIFKKAVVLALAGVMMAGNAVSAFAASGQWMSDENGRWWQRDDGTYPVSSWVWIDEDLDGIAELYYFGEDGYLLTNTDASEILGDNYPGKLERANENGAWTYFDRVQLLRTESLGEAGHQQEVVVPTADAVKDGRSWPQITFDETLFAAYQINGLGLLTNLKPSEPAYPLQDEYGPVYSMQIKGKTITLGTDTESNAVIAYFGPVGAFFNNFPEQGIELNAFYDNTGYESLAARRQPMTTTGMSDAIFKLPQASYWMGWGYVEMDNTYLEFQILLTAGEDGKWYIYPDSPIYV